MVLLLLFVYYLASCSMWDLSLWHTSYLIVAGGLSCPAACEILVPRPGMEPMSHVLTGRFLTTGPSEKSPKRCLTSLVFLCTHSLSHVWLCDPMDYLSMEFSRQEYWSGCYFLFQKIFLAQRLNPHLLHWQADPLPLCHLGKHWPLGKCKLKLQYYYITIRMIIIKKERLQLLVRIERNWNHHSFKNLNTELAYHLSIPLLRIYTQENWKLAHKSL